MNYVTEKMLLDKPLDNVVSGDSTFALSDLSIRPLKPFHKLKPSIEIMCNNQASYSHFF